MSAEAAAAAMAKAKPSSDYVYLGKRGVFGKYRLEIQALKFTEAGKPCIEAKVLASKATVAGSEPHKVGEVVSHIEDLSNPKNGGASRMLKALLAILNMSESDISKLEVERDGKVREMEGENAKSAWLVKMMDQKKCPTAFMQVDVEIEPRAVPAKGDKPAAVFSKERWSSVELGDTELDAIDAKRKAANLPSIAEALK